MKSREVRKQQPEYNEIERRLKEKLEQEQAGAASGDGEQSEPDAAHEEVESATPEASNPGDERIAQLEDELASVRDQYLRSRAEFENFRKRQEREQARFRASANESILLDLLPIIDNLERALQHADTNAEQIVQGVDMVLRQLRDALGNHGLAPIDAVGEPFDPNVHEAIAQSPSPNIPADHVSEEYQRGYRLGDRVLRPSRVVVSTGELEEQNSPPDTNPGADNVEK